MSEKDRDAPADKDPRAAPKPPSAAHPTTSEQWRQLLREDELPERIAELPFLKRRRARRAWRSARRDARTQWLKNERRNVPTPLTVPIVALLLAAAIAAVAVFSSDQDNDGTRAQPSASPIQHWGANPAPDPAPSPSASSTPARPVTPDALAKAFVTAYATRIPEQDETHRAAVKRAAPYASEGLVANLNRHDDLDWNQLIAAQATRATPTAVTVARPTAADRLPPDTDLRIYRLASARIDVKGTDNYAYTRRLTVEIARADLGQPWMVTRVLGIEE